MDKQPAEFENKLIPIMREGVDITKMVFYKQLKDHLSATHISDDTTYCSRLAGAVLNNLFGVLNREEPFASFAESNREIIFQILQEIPGVFAEMRIPLTDALRVQFLCDSLEGMERSSLLVHADDLGVLLQDRPVPLPRDFLAMVRCLGRNFNLLISLSGELDEIDAAPGAQFVVKDDDHP